MTIEPSMIAQEREEQQLAHPINMPEKKPTEMQSDSCESKCELEPAHPIAQREGETRGFFQEKQVHLLDTSISKNAKSATLRKAKRPPTKAHIRSTIAAAQEHREKEDEKKCDSEEADPAERPVQQRSEQEQEQEQALDAIGQSSNMMAVDSEQQAERSSVVLLAKQLAFGAGAVKLRSTGRRDLEGLQRSRDLDKECAAQESNPSKIGERVPSCSSPSLKMTFASTEGDKGALSSLVTVEEAKEEALEATLPAALTVETKPKARPTVLPSPSANDIRELRSSFVHRRTKSPSGLIESPRSPLTALAEIIHPNPSFLHSEQAKKDTPEGQAAISMQASAESLDGSLEATFDIGSEPRPESPSQPGPRAAEASEPASRSTLSPCSSSPPEPVLPGAMNHSAGQATASESPLDQPALASSTGFHLATCFPSCASWFKFGSKSKKRSGSKSPGRIESANQSPTSDTTAAVFASDAYEP